MILTLLEAFALPDMRQNESLHVTSRTLTLTSFNMNRSWQTMSEWMRPIMLTVAPSSVNEDVFCNPTLFSSSLSWAGLGRSMLPAASLWKKWSRKLRVLCVSSWRVLHCMPDGRNFPSTGWLEHRIMRHLLAGTECEKHVDSSCDRYR